MRFGFVSCVQLGLSCMEAIYEAGGTLQFAGSLHDHLAVAKSGRVYLDDFCRAHGVPLVKFKNINDPDALAAIRGASLDWLMIIGWSQIAREEILAAPRVGVLGMHPTLLPVGRGRAAIPWAILLQLPETGVTLFKLDGGVDTGPVLAQLPLKLNARESATTLYQRVNEAHRTLILEHWSRITSGQVSLRYQDPARATIWAGRTPEDGRLHASMTVADADRLVRAVTHPYPGAFIDLQGRRLRVWAAEPVTTSSPGQEPPEAVLLQFANGSLRVTSSAWETPPS